MGWATGTADMARERTADDESFAEEARVRSRVCGGFACACGRGRKTRGVGKKRAFARGFAARVLVWGGEEE